VSGRVSLVGCIGIGTMVDLAGELIQNSEFLYVERFGGRPQMTRLQLFLPTRGEVVPYTWQRFATAHCM